MKVLLNAFGVAAAGLYGMAWIVEHPNPGSYVVATQVLGTMAVMAWAGYVIYLMERGGS